MQAISSVSSAVCTLPLVAAAKSCRKDSKSWQWAAHRCSKSTASSSERWRSEVLSLTSTSCATASFKLSFGTPPAPSDVGLLPGGGMPDRSNRSAKATNAARCCWISVRCCRMSIKPSRKADACTSNCRWKADTFSRRERREVWTEPVKSDSATCAIKFCCKFTSPCNDAISALRFLRSLNNNFATCSKVTSARSSSSETTSAAAVLVCPSSLSSFDDTRTSSEPKATQPSS
mmetsp:Transcript_29764/g.74826  ORF Transcript_29764/g.74826 Transcript_29764/m.74826 type:complete len:232 (-) Transcript_29764:153-848(-)